MTKPRTALLIGLLFVACKVANPTYCPPGGASCELDGDAGIQGCASNAECTSSNAPVCDVDGDGTCVLCLGAGEQARCTVAAPVCEDRVCRACKVHSECVSHACLPNGTCAREGTIAYLDPAGTGSTCTREMPCAIAQRALDTGRSILKIHGTLTDGMTVNRSVTILADPDAKLTRNAGGPVLTLDNTITVEIDDLTIDRSQNQNDPAIQANAGTSLTLNHVTVSNASGNGITSLGASLTINRSVIINNALLGVSTSGAALKITSSVFYRNDGGGISSSGSTFDIVNTIIVHNGTAGSSVGGASLLSLAAAGSRFEFNTVADNHVKSSSIVSGGVSCDTAGLALPNNLIVHNEVNGDPNAVNANTFGTCTYPTSSISTSATDYGFVNSTTAPYDYRLSAGSLAIDKATSPSAVTVDFDGDVRPQGAAKDQGADEYRP